MKSLVLLLVLITVVALCTSDRVERGARRKKGRGRQKCQCQVANCELAQGLTCGKGTRTVTCQNINNPKCLRKSRALAKCKVKCRGNKGNNCRYGKPQWIDCDPNTKMRNGTMPLISGNETNCLAQKIIQKTCRPKCKYNKAGSKWSECDPVAKTKTKSFPLKQATPGCPSVKTITKTCVPRNRRDAAACKYERRVSFGPCDPGTGTKQRIKKKISGLESCPNSKVDVKKCKVKVTKATSCRYEKKVAFGPCDASTKTKTRTKVKIAGGSECPATKEETKQCTPRATTSICRYEKVAFGPCDNSTKIKSRIRPKIAGGPECPATKQDSKPCQLKGACSYGKWASYGDCNNGVRTKTRQLLSGDTIACQRRASKTKPC